VVDGTGKLRPGSLVVDPRAPPDAGAEAAADDAAVAPDRDGG
jgi:hypothetical protein